MFLLNLHPGNVFLLGVVWAMITMLREEGYFDGEELRLLLSDIQEVWKKKRAESIRKKRKRRLVKRKKRTGKIVPKTC